MSALVFYPRPPALVGSVILLDLERYLYDGVRREQVAAHEEGVDAVVLMHERVTFLPSQFDHRAERGAEVVGPVVLEVGIIGNHAGLAQREDAVELHADHLRPRPGDLVSDDWSPELKSVVVGHLERGGVLNSYRGTSLCRLCGQSNGSRELTDYAYVWPEGYAHYVRDHGVKPPAVFVYHVLQVAGD